METHRCALIHKVGHVVYWVLAAAKCLFKRKQRCVEHPVVFMQALPLQHWGTAFFLIRQGLYLRRCWQLWHTPQTRRGYLKASHRFKETCCKPVVIVGYTNQSGLRLLIGVFNVFTIADDRDYSLCSCGGNKLLLDSHNQLAPSSGEMPLWG